EQTVDWAERYRQSPEAARYLRIPAAPIANPASRSMTPPAPVPRQQSPLTQFQVLCARYLAVIAADWQYLVCLAALPLVLSALAPLVSGPAGLSMIEKSKDREGPGSPAQLLLVLIIAGAFVGFAGAFRELVKERAIYRREQAIGLTISAYLA